MPSGAGFRWNDRNDVGSHGERSPDQSRGRPQDRPVCQEACWHVGLPSHAREAGQVPARVSGRAPVQPRVSRPGRSSPGLPAVGLLGQRRSGGPELEGETDPLCCPLAASRGCRLALSPGGRRGSGWSRPLLLPIGASWESLRHPRNLAPFCVRDKARTHDNEVL